MGSQISSLLQGSSSVDGVEGTQKSGATVSTEADAESVDSSSDGSDEPLDVLGMEADFAEASDDEDAGQEEKQAEEGPDAGLPVLDWCREYFSELDEQLESALDGELSGQEAASTDDALPLSSRHIKVHGSDPLELDMHAMEHVLASFCSEHQLEPGPASVLLGELGLAGGGLTAGNLDTLD
eukprot:s502_g15.t1